ncbi:MAG: hypothetical protein FWE36_00470 [Erysipelotrichales bacterium]|nr:hypothetical protein [Erysipelotrichales bacterium]
MNSKKLVFLGMLLIMIILGGLAFAYWSSQVSLPSDEDSDGNIGTIGRWVEFDVWKSNGVLNYRLNSGETLTVVHRIGTLTSAGTNITTTVSDYGQVTSFDLSAVPSFEITFRASLPNAAARLRALIDEYFENSDFWHVSTSQNSSNSEVRLGFRNDSFQFHLRVQINNQAASGSNPPVTIHNIAWLITPIPTTLNPANDTWMRTLNWTTFNANPDNVPAITRGISSNNNSGQVVARQYVMPLNWTYEVVNPQNANVDIRTSGNNRVITIWAFVMGSLPTGWWDNLPQ